MKKLIVLFVKLKSWLEKLELKIVLEDSGIDQLKNKLIIGRYWRIHIEKGGNLNVGLNVVFRSFCNILIHNHGKVIIGDNVFFNNYCSINCIDTIKIGENTMFGEAVKLYDHNHSHFKESDKIIIERNRFTSLPISIGSNCWIGSNVTILKGVTIGDNVIIGANNLIIRSIPSNTIIKFDSAH